MSWVRTLSAFFSRTCPKGKRQRQHRMCAVHGETYFEYLLAYSVVDGRTCGSLLTTRDTVFIETPARPATSNTVAFGMSGKLTSE